MRGVLWVVVHPVPPAPGDEQGLPSHERARQCGGANSPVARCQVEWGEVGLGAPPQRELGPIIANRGATGVPGAAVHPVLLGEGCMLRG